MLRTVCAFLSLPCALFSSCFSTRELPTPLPSDPIAVAVLTEQARQKPPEPVAVAPPASSVALEVDLAPPVDVYAAVTYTLRQLPPDELIRIAWAGTGQEARALAIARRESGLRCDADNPRSSASGLFQTLSLHRARAERLGLSWANVTGPDCLDDVLLAFDMWEDSGWGPWRI